MTILTATTASESSSSNVWKTALFAGLATAIIAYIVSLGLGWESPIVYIAALVLIGIGPLIGFQFSSDSSLGWAAYLGGLIGPIIPIFGWPILVGLLAKSQSVGKLILASLLATVIGIGVFLLLQTFFGLNPYFVGTSFAIGAGCWGGTLGAGMEAWKKTE